MFTSTTPRNQRRKGAPSSSASAAVHASSQARSAMSTPTPLQEVSSAVAHVKSKGHTLLLQNDLRSMAVIAAMPQLDSQSISHFVMDEYVESAHTLCVAWNAHSCWIWSMSQPAQVQSIPFANIFSQCDSSRAPLISFCTSDVNGPSVSNPLLVSSSGEIVELGDLFVQGRDIKLVATDKITTLAEGDVLSHIVRLPHNAGHCVFTLTMSASFMISRTSRGAQVAFNISTMSKPESLLGKVSGWLTGAVTVSKNLLLSAHLGGVSTDGGRELITVQQNGDVTCRSIRQHDTDKWMFECNVNSLIQQQVLKNGFDPTFAQITSVAPGKNGRLNLLLSLRAQQRSGGTKLAMAWLDRDSNMNMRSAGFSVLDVDKDDPVSFELSVPNGGPTVFVHSKNLIILLVISNSTHYVESIPFKSSSNSQIIWAGSDPIAQWSLLNESVSSLWLLISNLGLVKLDAFTERILQERKLNNQTASYGDTRLVSQIKSQLEQAVFLGADNPISFKVDSKQSKELGLASSLLSSEIVRAQCNHLSSIVDVKELLNERLVAQERIIHLLANFLVLEDIPSECLTAILQDNVRLYVAVELWQYNNTIVGRQMSEADSQYLSIFETCITRLHAAGRQGQVTHGYAAVRHFFRDQLTDMNQLVAVLMNEADRLMTGAHKKNILARNLSVLEIANVLMHVYKSCVEVGAHLQQLFTLNKSNCIQWIINSTIVDSLRKFLSWLFMILEEYAHKDRNVDCSDQMTDITHFQLDQPPADTQVWANVLKFCIVQLTDMFLLILGDGDQGRSQEALLGVAQIGCMFAAVHLAEKYQKYSALVKLIHMDFIRFGGNIPRYLENFSSPFALILCEWYLQKGSLRALLELPIDDRGLMRQFLRDNNRLDMLWVYEMKCGDYGAASKLQTQMFQAESDINNKEILVSLAKLTRIASLPRLEDDSVIEPFDVELHKIRIQNGFASQFREWFADKLSGDSVSQQTIGDIAYACSTKMGDRPVLRKMYASLLQRLLTGEALDSSELVDLFTLNFGDLVNEQRFRFCLAVELVVAVQSAVNKEQTRHLAATVLRRSLFALEAVWKRYEGKLDGVISREMQSLFAVNVLSFLHDEGTIPVISKLADLKLKISTSVAEDMQMELERENVLLDYYADSRNLEVYYDELLRLANVSVE